MIYKEIIDDLFKYDNEYILAHCISADSGYDNKAMGAGIVVQFNKYYNMKNKILNYAKTNKIEVGDAIFIDNVFNLITKPYYYNKPNYNDFTKSILSMKNYCIKNKISKLAVPTIGCGIDKLQWTKVREILKNVFNDTNIEILVCFYNKFEWDKWNISHMS